MSRKPTVLIVDDEKNTREGLARALNSDYRVLLAAHGREALERAGRELPDVVLSDIRMPGMDGLTLMQRLLALQPQPVCIVMTAYGSIETAVEAMRRGAYDYMTKPVNLDELELTLRRALHARSMEGENRDLRKQLDAKYGLEQLVGESPAMQEVFDTIRQVAPTRATVMIEGESGTGKELVARALHRLSPRARGPFVAVHCAALAETLLESELFGHERGAFTGAVERRQGRFEVADGGTLFLDEVSEIPLSVQVKILRVLEERAFERVGGQETIETDTRLLAATNRNLKERVEQGAFREDLYYRLQVIALRLPPLRERAGDVPLLTHHFIKTLSAENGKSIEGLTVEAVEALCAYDWPGNVRELRNVVERMVVLTRGNRLTLRDLPASLRGGSAPSGAPRPDGNLSLQDAEKRHIVEALRASGGNRTDAAARLGISRRTLHRKLNAYGLRE